MEFTKKIKELKKSGFFESLEIERGIEKESLRVDQNGNISNKKHPKALGSSFTNPSITTDFAEALVEIVTPVFTDVDDLHDHLLALHVFINKNIDEEIIWPFSIPPRIKDESKINIATYANNKAGHLKYVYRKGLAARYGKTMQCVSGIHFNFSLSDSSMRDLINSNIQDDIDSAYLRLIRNFKRVFWFVLTEFGESAVVDKSFVRNRENDLNELNETDLYKEDATSLRMSEIGYKSPAQENLNIHYNDLNSFLKEIKEAIIFPYPEFSKLNMKDEDGLYSQISDGILQIENELYDCIRPKRAAHGDVRPYDILKREGIKYVEVRGIDLSPKELTGISKNQIRILDLILLYCLIDESPEIDNQEFDVINCNDQAAIKSGRNKNTKIIFKKDEISIGDARNKIIKDLMVVAEMMNGEDHKLALKSLNLRKNIFNPAVSFNDAGIELAKKNHSEMLKMKDIDMKSFIKEAEDSLIKFDKISDDTIDDVNNFLAGYNKNL